MWWLIRAVTWFIGGQKGALGNAAGWDSLDFRVEFTDTHIIALYYHWQGLRGRLKLIQIFTIPPDGSPVKGGNPVLCLTHEGFADCWLSSIGITMKPSVDPITGGATHIRFLGQFSSSKGLNVTCIDLILPKSSGPKVLPMTVDIHHISIPKEGVKTSCYVDSFQYLELCDDRLLRGFYMERHDVDDHSQKIIMKFTIDTSQDPLAITCGQMMRTEWSDIADPGFNLGGIVFDGVRGRLCYADSKIKDQIVVVDIE